MSITSIPRFSVCSVLFLARPLERMAAALASILLFRRNSTSNVSFCVSIDAIWPMFDAAIFALLRVNDVTLSL